MTNATAINAVPVWEDVYVGTTQEWSLRLNVLQHGETHQVLTHTKNWQIDRSFLIPRAPRGRSELVESLVWLIPSVCEKRRENEREDERQDQGIKRK